MIQHISVIIHHANLEWMGNFLPGGLDSPAWLGTFSPEDILSSPGCVALFFLMFFLMHRTDLHHSVLVSLQPEGFCFEPSHSLRVAFVGNAICSLTF